MKNKYLLCRLLIFFIIIISVSVHVSAQSKQVDSADYKKSKTVTFGSDSKESTYYYTNELISKYIKHNIETKNNDIDNLLLVNRYNPLPSNFKAKNLVELSSSKIKLSSSKAILNNVVRDALYGMLDAAKKDNITGYVSNSTVRSIEVQNYLYQNRLNINKKNKVKDPERETLKRVAKPGISEHHTGLSMDILSTNGNSATTFGKTEQSKWLNENCYKYGFIIRYPKDKQEITETMYEPWHIRYVGLPHSMIMKKENMCFEEYINYLRENKVIVYELNNEKYSITYINLDEDSSKLNVINHKLSEAEISKVVENQYVLTTKLD